MDRESSIYITSYKRIEKEVRRLSSSILFCDSQKEVYSFDIADLIMRCAIDIESISKDIYRRETTIEPPKSSICFKWMEENWKITKKEVLVDSQHFFFEDKEMKKVMPFEYRRNSQDDYYSVYNALKHDRLKNLNKATIYVLVRIMAALFVLNILYKKDRFALGDDRTAQSFDRTCGSEFFSVGITPYSDAAVLDSDMVEVHERNIYRVVRKEPMYSARIVFIDQQGKEKSINLYIHNNEKFKTFIEEAFERNNINEEELWKVVAACRGNTMETEKAMGYTFNNINRILYVKPSRTPYAFWAELNL